MPLNYAHIYDERLKNKFKAMVESGQAIPKPSNNESTNVTKSDVAKDAQILRSKQLIDRLNEQVRELREENELLYRKLSERLHVH